MSPPSSIQVPSETGSSQSDFIQSQPLNELLPIQLQQSVQRPVFMPETFTGMGRDWSDWAEWFELASEVNHWE